MIKKCLKLLGSGLNSIPGTGSDCRVFVSLTILGLGPSILLMLVINYKFKMLALKLNHKQPKHNDLKIKNKSNFIGIGQFIEKRIMQY